MIKKSKEKEIDKTYKSKQEQSRTKTETRQNKAIFLVKKGSIIDI